MPVGCYWFGVFVIAVLSLLISPWLSLFVVVCGIIIFFLAATTGGNENNP